MVSSESRRLSSLKKVNNRAHYELAKGSTEANFNYCSKDNKVWEYGDRNKCGQGKRNDLKDIVTKPIEDIIRDHPDIYVKFHKGIKDLTFQKDLKIINHYNNKLIVSSIIGKPGSGKTRYVLDKHKPENVYILDAEDSKLWFDGYNGQEILLIDDFYGNIKYSYMLRLIDKYHLKLQVKNGFVVSKWNKIYITSNNEIKHWYNNMSNIDALKRRINESIML